MSRVRSSGIMQRRYALLVQFRNPFDNIMHTDASQPPLTDSTTSLAELRRMVEEFVRARSWEPFHTPKNLSMALAIEAAELMEHFQWLTSEQAEQVKADPMRCAAVADELADVLCYVMALANRLGIDLSAAVQAKMVKNAEKYPIEQFRGFFGPEDPRWPGYSSSED
jgi:NTP pyrophosphatase (non-canonical NTP hydrolase)